MISVIMPVYNSEKYLDKAILSVLNQTYKVFEFLIVDDSSTDRSKKIIEKYQKKDKRIKIIYNKRNLGVVKSISKALQIARGGYIARMDADDISMPDRLKIEKGFLDSNKHVYLVGSAAININENGRKISLHRPILDFGEIKKKLLIYNCIYHPTIMFRNNGSRYREKMLFCEDYDFYLRLLTEGKIIVNLENYLLKYRVQPNSAFNSKRVINELFAQKAREFYFQRVKSGSDQYDKFDPRKILDLDLQKSTDKNILQLEIKEFFRLNDFDNVRKYGKKYFRIYGYQNKKIILYYLLSFAGKKFVNFLRIILNLFLNV